MRRPPEAHYSFSIPSIHDDTTLDCRIYQPDALLRPDNPDDIAKWSRKGIVMAHPYAPMGGSFDDRIVGIVIDEFLHAGFIVGVFNFRGAHGSKGRTSWTGKPELDDYISFAAFFMHYISNLQPSLPYNLLASEQSPMSPNFSESAPVQSDVYPLVVLGGYSYGSLILRNLPPVLTILQPFAAPPEGSAAEEIVLRASKLADQSNMEWVTLARDETRARRKDRAKHNTRPSITMGGEETSPGKRRSSREVRRSLEGSSRLEIRTRLRSLSHRRRDNAEVTTPTKVETTNFTVPDVRYLLISPLTPPLSSLAAPALMHKFWSRSKDDHQETVGKHVTLAIYGDQDIFASAKKLRDWAEQLKASPGSRFRSLEVADAGHFWVEHGVEEKLRVAMREWIVDM
ncbi:hypothetical protein GGP41_010618 [Bipolaris sorokiniana]|uniref:AB hydrolase-1 domain-containing protein n=2 Tax=Cochliobolus sativus TaxID=45130 RepID=A0A8H6DX08_COCSA|nr:hypothetical protein GGP41_010618 [Bipolaris sorokiniana]